MSEANGAGRIAAVVATPSKGNTGMRVVNDALVRWLDSRGLAARADLFQFETPAHRSGAREASGFRCILDLAPERYARIVVWGDFLLDRNWTRKACERVARERGVPAGEVERHVEAVIYGGDAPGARAPRRSVVGQCFLVSDRSYETDAAYRERFARLARDAEPFLMRDPLSLARAAVFAGAPLSALPPLDAALLRPALREPAGAPTPGAPRAGFGLFFGRTGGAFAAKAAAALAAAREGAGPAHYLRWLPARAVPAWLRWLAGAEARELPEELDDVIALLRGLRFVVTDTYHLAVVCWSIGVPAICLGAGAQRFEHSVHDKKKELFYLSQRIERFHLFAEERFAPAYAQATEMLREIAADDPGPVIARQIRAQAELVLAALAAALRAP